MPRKANFWKISIEMENKHFVYTDGVIDMVATAARICLCLEHSAEMDRQTLLDELLCLLPILYAKTRLVKEPERMSDDEAQHFVMEEDYNYIEAGVKNLLGTDDAYLELLTDDQRYNDEPTTAYISENVADIYQELKDMAAAYQTGQEAVMNDAVAACIEAFHTHWGQKLLNAVRAMHALSEEYANEEE